MKFRNENRLWRFFYAAGRPVKICGGNERHTPEEVIQGIIEEYPGQREHLHTIMLGTQRVRRSMTYKGKRFILVCVA